MRIFSNKKKKQLCTYDGDVCKRQRDSNIVCKKQTYEHMNCDKFLGAYKLDDET